MNAYNARLLVEDPHIGRCYAELVKQTRLVAGAHIKAAWDSDPVAEDEEMHASAYDFSALREYHNRFLRAVARHLSWKPGGAQRSAQTSGEPGRESGGAGGT